MELPRLATGLVDAVCRRRPRRSEARARQLVPFGDVPATDNSSEAEMATARPQSADRPLIYAPWRKVCFRASQAAESKMVCRTTMNGRWDTGQIALRLDLIEREGDPVARLQIFVPPGSFLQPGIKLTVDQGSADCRFPTSSVCANGCAAGSAGDRAA